MEKDRWHYKRLFSRDLYSSTSFTSAGVALQEVIIVKNLKLVVYSQPKAGRTFCWPDDVNTKKSADLMSTCTRIKNIDYQREYVVLK